jgi:hypothetical protein
MGRTSSFAEAKVSRSRVLSLLVVGPWSAAAGFYVAGFAFQLIARLLSYATMFSIVALYLLGVVSSSSESGAAPLLVFEWAQTSIAATDAAGSLGALASLLLATRAVRAAPEASAWRRALRFGAVAGGVAVLAAGADLRYELTPYIEPFVPRSDFAAARRDVTCPMSVTEIAQSNISGNGCVTEVEGVLVYLEHPRRFELVPAGAGYPSIRVYFTRGGRTLFGGKSPRLPPRYYDRVSRFVGKRVRIVGTAVPGVVTADFAHIVLADASAPSTPRAQ